MKIKRVPIITKGKVYQTIASHNGDFTDVHVMGQYPDIETARYHYSEDMDNFRRTQGGASHYAIRLVELSDENKE